MGEFYYIAEMIAIHVNELARSGKIGVEEIADICRAAIGKEINLYPGVSGHKCHDLSLFISLSSPEYAKGKHGHLSCRQAIEKVVQHMQGSCINKTYHAILITDSWDSSASYEWRSNLQQIDNFACFEIYLIARNRVSEIKI